MFQLFMRLLYDRISHLSTLFAIILLQKEENILCLDFA